jgi:small redox-active disulfide protein 2
MGLFSKRNKDVEPASCSCGGNCNSEAPASSVEENTKIEGTSVKILGSGCSKCNQLEAATKEALKKLDMDAAIDHITDFSQIAAYGVMTTPALVIDGKVVSYGKVLEIDEIIKILQKAR